MSHDDYARRLNANKLGKESPSFVFQQQSRKKRKHCPEDFDAVKAFNKAIDKHESKKLDIQKNKEQLQTHKKVTIAEIEARNSQNPNLNPNIANKRQRNNNSVDVHTTQETTQPRNVRNQPSSSSNYQSLLKTAQAINTNTTNNNDSNKSTSSLPKKKYPKNLTPTEPVCKGYAVNYSSIYAKFQVHHQRVYESQVELSMPTDIYEQYLDKKHWRQTVSAETILKNLNVTLDSLGLIRTDQQKVFHRHMVNAVLPKIYGDTLMTHKERILKENNWDDIKQEVLVVTPRRFGKTWGVAMFSAACLICIPNFEIVIFSMALRASRKMLALIDKFLTRHPEGSKMICRPHTQESLSLEGPESGDERTCKSFPGRSEVSSESIPPQFLGCGLEEMALEFEEMDLEDFKRPASQI